MHDPDDDTPEVDEITAQTVAEAAGKFFVVRERADGEEYTTLKDAPGWLFEAVYTAGGDMPDNYTYEMASGALDSIAYDGISADMGHEFADSAVSAYTLDRARWLASSLSRFGWCDEARAEFGSSEGVGDLLAQGWYMEANHVYAAMSAAVEAEVERQNDAAQEEHEGTRAELIADEGECRS